MPYVNQNILKSFVAKNNWLTIGAEPEGLSEAILQADDIIRSWLGLTVPDDPADAPPILRNVACALIVWYTTGQQGKIEDAEYNRRRDQYNNAMDTLKLIKTGDITLNDANGTPLLETRPTSFFSSDTPKMEKL